MHVQPIHCQIYPAIRLIQCLHLTTIEALRKCSAPGKYFVKPRGRRLGIKEGCRQLISSDFHAAGRGGGSLDTTAQKSHDLYRDSNVELRTMESSKYSTGLGFITSHGLCAIE